MQAIRHVAAKLIFAACEQLRPRRRVIYEEQAALSQDCHVRRVGVRASVLQDQTMRDGTRELRRIYAITTELEVACDAIMGVAHLSEGERRRAVNAVLAHHFGRLFDAGTAQLSEYITALDAREAELARVKESRARLQAQLAEALKRLREGK